MQTKIFTAALAALSFATVDAAVAKRQAVTITPGTFVSPSVTFDPSALPVQEAALRALQMLRGDFAKTIVLVNQLNTAASGTLASRAAQASAVAVELGNVALNFVSKARNITASLGPRVGGSTPQPPPSSTLPGVPSPTESVSALAQSISAEVEAIAEQARQLGLAAAAQLTTLGQQQATVLETITQPVAVAALTAAKTAADVTLRTALTTIGTSANLIVGTASNAVATANGAVGGAGAAGQEVLGRISRAQVTLNPALDLSLTPRIIV